MSTSQELKKLKVAELKALCTEKGLATTGKKDDLVTRLLENAETTEVEVEEAIVDEPPAEADESPAPTVEVTTTIEKVVAEAPKAATTAEERKAARAARFGIASAETEADAVEKRKAARSARFGLDSNASMTSKQASNDGLSEEQIDQLKKRSERFGAVTSTALLAEVKKEKKAASASEREAERAAKAAMQAIEDEKKRKRAERFGLAGTTTSKHEMVADSAEVEAKKKARLERFGASS